MENTIIVISCVISFIIGWLAGRQYWKEKCFIYKRKYQKYLKSCEYLLGIVKKDPDKLRELKKGCSCQGK